MMKIDLKIFHCLGGADPSSRRLSASWGNCHLCPDLYCFWTPQVLPAGCYLSGSAYQHNRRSEVTFMKCGFYYFYYLSFFLQIIQETVLAQYQQALRRWEEARQQNDYAATDKKPSSNTSEKVIFFLNSNSFDHLLNLRLHHHSFPCYRKLTHQK